MLRTIQRWNNSQRYSTCALNSHVPSGLRFDLSGIDTLVYLGTHEGRGYIELRVDVPEGLTLQLESSLVKATTRGPDGVAGSDFPSVSLVDTPIVNAFSTVPDVRARQLPPTIALVGGRLQAGNRSSGLHYGSPPIDVKSASEVVIMLPAFRINGTLSVPPRIHFKRQSMVGVATFNC